MLTIQELSASCYTRVVCCLLYKSCLLLAIQELSAACYTRVLYCLLYKSFIFIILNVLFIFILVIILALADKMAAQKQNMTHFNKTITDQLNDFYNRLGSFVIWDELERLVTCTSLILIVSLGPACL